MNIRLSSISEINKRDYFISTSLQVCIIPFYRKQEMRKKKERERETKGAL